MGVSVGTLWVRGPLPNLAILCINSWARAGYTVSLYSYETPSNSELLDTKVRLVLAGRIAEGPSKSQLADPKFSLAGFSNHFRMQMILETGELWLDTDILSTGKILDDPGLVVGREDKHTINGAVLGARDGHPLIHELSKSIKRLGRGKYLFGDLGPALITRQVSAMGLEGLVYSRKFFYEIGAIESWKLFSAHCRDEVEHRLSEGFFVHLWNETMSTVGFDPTTSTPQRGSFLHALDPKFWDQTGLGELNRVDLNSWERRLNSSARRNSIARVMPRIVSRGVRLIRGDARSRLFYD